jgi:ring-1,2-phenylacetyl-CoA epoxidase subunit PaaD
MVNAEVHSLEHLRTLLDEVRDPEVPVLSILDLGVVRKIDLHEDQPEITITPTYSGCPAMDMIRSEIIFKLVSNGYKQPKIIQVLSPAWTSDWMSEEGKAKLLAYGIAPPTVKVSEWQRLEDLHIACPHCGSTNTRVLSEFGSTACKALLQCNDCKEPFDHFKCH